MLHSSWLMAGGDTSNVARVPTLHLSEPNSDDKDKNPKKTIETLGDPEDPDTPPKEPNQRNPEDGDKPGKPKTPKGKEGDGPDGTGKPAKDPNQRNPDGGDEPGKPKTPKEKGEDGPEDTGKSPKEPNPKEKKKPKKTNTLEVEENIEEETDVNNANNEDSNKFKSNQRITKRRSPAKKNPKRLEDDSDDPSENPSPSDKKKKKPNSNSPDKKKGKPTDEDVDEDISPSDKGSNKPNSNKPNKKKAKPTKEDDDEPSKPGKGKKPKKKPNSKAISKIKKKKVNSEEERQETVESEFSSSSQSSSSHTRSKSTRRLTGKNKKKLKDQKKKFPELPPEDPLMPPDPKKDKELLPTPEPTFKDGGSGDDGSGMDFLSTTIQPTTLVIHSTTTASPTTTQKNQTEGTSNPSTSSTRNPGVTSERGRISTMTILPTTEATEKTTIMMSTSPQSTTAKDKTTGKSTSPETPPQQMSTLKTPEDQSTTGSSGITPTTVSGKVQETTNTLSFSSESVDPTKQTHPVTDNGKYITKQVRHKTNAPSEFTNISLDRNTGYLIKDTNIMPFSITATTQKSEKALTKETINQSDITANTETTTGHSEKLQTTQSKITAMEPNAEPQQTLTTEQPVKLTTGQPEEESEVSTIMSTEKHTPTPAKSVVETTTKYTEEDDSEMSTKSVRPTKTPDHTRFPTKRPMKPEEVDHTKSTKSPISNPYHVCDLLKDEAIKVRISEDDLQHVTRICTEMQRHYLLNNPHMVMPNWNQQPGTRIIQIAEEIYRRMNRFPMINVTVVHDYTIHKPTKWLLLLNRIKSSNDPLKNLCIGQPADGMTTLQNGSMVVFRGPYFWMLHQGGVIGNPRKITEVWGIPSPIDTVFTRCNCGGKTFFFKGSRYWRFTNDVMDQGYPKEIIKGFGGLSGKITAVLPIAGFRTRPESVYFFKPGGYVQKYTFRQEQAKKCTKKKRPSIQYPIYSQKVQTVRYRFPRDIVRHRIQIHRTYTTVQQPLGVLHEQTLVSATWRGVPNNIISAISLPNHAKQDGFDYYTFTKDKYYNINMSSKVAVKPPPGAEQKTTKDWYKCKE
ncbi:hypothetical protein GDO81_017964 [Engystomops pustulosus]|uniref:Proteoglycan 4 n=1 Tax=Engystomops pustulosus TaxID=76066 RepID=A0AAV7A7T1_ENGPU|nr:hypothetical protein GDO81_017964 [Engystomops pustulosus]